MGVTGWVGVGGHKPALLKETIEQSVSTEYIASLTVPINTDKNNIISYIKIFTKSLRTISVEEEMSKSQNSAPT